MRRSLRGVLSRVNQLAARARALGGGDGFDHVAAILTQARRRRSERRRMFSERGYPETAAERYSRHLEHKPSYTADDLPGMPQRLSWAFRRRLEVWTRLQPEYAAEAAREEAGYPPVSDPAWWAKSDDDLRESARGSGAEALLVVGELIAMRRARHALLEARRGRGSHA